MGRPRACLQTRSRRLAAAFGPLASLVLLKIPTVFLVVAPRNRPKVDSRISNVMPLARRTRDVGNPVPPRSSNNVQSGRKTGRFGPAEPTINPAPSSSLGEGALYSPMGREARYVEKRRRRASHAD